MWKNYDLHNPVNYGAESELRERELTVHTGVSACVVKIPID